MFREIAKDKNFWKKVREDEGYKPLVDRLLELYDEVGKEEDIPALKFSEYKMFFETGNRMVYEKHYFYKRKRMNCFALLALIYPEKEEYIVKLEDAIWSICDEYNWVLPAHTKDYPMPDKRTVDLFSAETGYALSEITFLLKDRLSELIINRVEEEVEERIINRFINNYQNWENNKANWAAVCAGSVAAAVMYNKPQVFSLVGERITSCMENFLEGYHDDGVCLEGIGYWEYGFGFFIWYADMLKDFTDGEKDLFECEKIKQIATFAQKAYITESCTVTFSDANPGTKIMVGMIHFLKTVYPDAISAIPLKSCKTDDHCGRWCHHVRSFTFFNPDYVNEGFENDAEYFPVDSAWYIKKTPAYSFVIKGGNNDEPHNHNDVGSFILAKGDKQLLADIGGGEYTKQYFNPETRYTILCNSSLGHSVPIINGKQQEAGAEFSGKISVEGGIVTVDMKDAYDEPSLKKLERRVELCEHSLKITDSCEFENGGECVYRFVSFIEPEILSDGLKIDEAIIKYNTASANVKITEEKHTTHIENEVIPVYLIDFKTDKGYIEFEIECE